MALYVLEFQAEFQTVLPEEELKRMLYPVHLMLDGVTETFSRNTGIPKYSCSGEELCVPGLPVFCRDANGQVSPRYLRSTSSIFPASSKRVITFMHSEMEFRRITLFVLASFFILISFYRGRSLYHRTLVVKHFPKYGCLSSLPSRLSEKST